MDLRPPTATLVRAAGGVVWRRGSQGAPEFALVHRPAYDDWSLPKGKLHSGETEEDCALREVAEETGLRCRLGRPLGTTSYVDRKGRPKIVYYWLMRPLAGRFAANEEIDEMRWLPLAAAVTLLTEERDRTLLASLGDPGDDGEATG